MDPVSQYIMQEAAARGIDPNIALRFFQKESNLNPGTRPGDGGSSFGIAQLHYGGINPAMPYAGLGDAYTAATGKDARDPNGWRQQVQFALDNVQNHGWSDYATTRNKLGLTNFSGVGGNGGLPAGRLDPSAQMDNADPLANATAALKGVAIGNAAAGIAPQATPLAIPGRIDPTAIEDTGDPLAAATKAIGTPSQAGAGAGVLPTAHPITGPATPIPTLSQQAEGAGRNALGYWSGQVGGIPAAVSQDYQAATARNVLGNEQLNAGQLLPSFPSSDPRTWGAGGLLNTFGGMAGQVASPITGAVRQLVEQPVTEATGNPEIGARAGFVANSLAAPMAGRLMGAGANALGNATLGGLDPETAQLANLAQTKYRIPITAPQMAGGTSVMKIGSNALDRLPFSGASAARDAQMEPYYRGLAAEIGEPQATSLTPSVMSHARTQIGSMFDTVANNTTLHIDPQYVQDVHDVLNYANQTLTAPEAAIINRQAQNIVDKIDPATKTIDGQTYLALTKHNAPLNSLMESDNSNIANAAKGLDNALDSMLARSAAPEYQDMLATARRQWAALKTLEPLAAKAATPGQISPGLLAGRVNAQTGNGMAYGWGGNLGELAQIGRRFLMEPGSSNTAERALTYATLGGLAGDAFRATTGGMGLREGAATLAGVPLALGGARLANAGARSQWLANALINRSLAPTAPSAGLSPSLGLLGGSAGLLAPPVNALGAPNQ